MNKIFLILLLVFVVALSACSQYALTNETPVINNNDSFLFTEQENQTTNKSNQTTNTSNQTTNMSEGAVSESMESISTVTVTEGEVVDLSFLTAQDPDGDSIRFTYSDPFNTLGRWSTEDGDQGTYLVQVTASDGTLSTSESVRVVVTPSNKGPVIDCPTSITVKENEELTLSCDIYDEEGDNVSYTVSGFMTGFKKNTTYDDAGEYEVEIVATDGMKETMLTIDVTVENVNRPPVVTAEQSYSVMEGELVDIDLEVTDPDGDAIEIEYPILFSEQGMWETDRGDAGNYELEAEVSDGVDTVAVPIEIIVQQQNAAPELSGLEDIVVQEGETITLNVSASDPDGDEITIEYSGFMDSRTYTTTYDDAGEYMVNITVSDAKHTVHESISVTVENVNRPPFFVVR